MSKSAAGSVPSVAAPPHPEAAEASSITTNLAVAGGVVALLGAAALLWAQEGVGVFATALLSRLSACL